MTNLIEYSPSANQIFKIANSILEGTGRSNVKESNNFLTIAPQYILFVPITNEKMSKCDKQMYCTFFSK